MKFWPAFIKVQSSTKKFRAPHKLSYDHFYTDLKIPNLHYKFQALLKFQDSAKTFSALEKVFPIYANESDKMNSHCLSA